MDTVTVISVSVPDPSGALLEMQPTWLCNDCTACSGSWMAIPETSSVVCHGLISSSSAAGRDYLSRLTHSEYLPKYTGMHA
jgi:hypothetical protein